MPARLLVSLAALAGLLPAQDEQEAEAPPAKDAAPAPDERAGYGLRGTLELRYVGRWTDGAHDNDLIAYGTLDAGDPDRHVITAHASGRSAWDVDRDRDPTHPFFDIENTYSGDLTARLYSAYVDVNGVADGPLGTAVERVRLGRQILTQTPETLFLDGAALETAPVTDLADLTVTVFAGVPAHLFESSPSEDFTAGAAVELTPWPAGSLRFDYLHVQDRYVSLTSHDDLFGVRFSQRIAGKLFVDSFVNVLEGDARDFGLHAAWTDVEHDLRVTARYNALFGDQRRHSIDLDYFTPILSTFFAYHQWELHAHKGIGDHLFLEGGAQLRELEDDADEGIFNHEFQRYFAAPGLSGWPWGGLTATLTFELWDSGGDEFTAFGGDVTQDLGERWEASAGTFFQLYRYDVLADQEREDVQVSYVKLTFDPEEWLRLRASFEFEDGDTEDFATITFGSRVDF